MELRSSANVNLAALQGPLENLCRECDDHNSTRCDESRCLVGFARKTINFASQKGLLDIPGARELIPAGDFRPRYAEQLAPGIAATCRQCKECRDNHSPDCIIALVRTCLESMLLPESIEYPGSVFVYLARLREQDPQLAELVAKEMSKDGRNQ